MSKQVGYLTNYASGIQGERGTFYNYTLAGNGLFIEASNRVLSARIPVAACEVRGLAPMKPKITPTYGSIPQNFFDQALNSFLASPDKESYVAVTADAGYHFYVPSQEQQEAKVTYDIVSSVILDIHSHGTMPAFFSGQDDKDETGFQMYAVVGELRKEPMVCLRIGVYGYFWPLSWKEVFDGTLYGAKESEEEGLLQDVTQDTKQSVQQEVKQDELQDVTQDTKQSVQQEVKQDELHGIPGGEAGEAEVHSSGMWWYKWFK